VLEDLLTWGKQLQELKLGISSDHLNGDVSILAELAGMQCLRGVVVRMTGAAEDMEADIVAALRDANSRLGRRVFLMDK
jgi:hypothetical protein